MRSQRCLSIVFKGGPGPPFFPLFSIQICYMSVSLFSKKFTQFGFFCDENKLTLNPEASYAPFHLKEPSLSLPPPSVEFILYRVIVIFLKIANVTLAD